ncbi:hypothetical protein CHS0354_008419 [Potamilus streckersoni]|uniref:HMG box domain-containing protein n=1 Tax=Potamilus streckersoni TaxID=2493646 RepID=A0AAE0RPP0_9BIVA|nr:hypothetical protein CHS0354_008419 [Potamilus streckersoni]
MDSPPDLDKREIRRPMNAFLIFCKRHRSMVREKNPDLDNRNVTRILGDLWANLKDEEKTVYTDLAKQYKDAFMKANPDYKWHNPEKMPQGPKVSPKAGSVRSMKSELDLLVETGPITPGKLADPSNMGGLSMLLMAGQQTMPSSSRQVLCPITSVADQKKANTEAALPWEEHMDKPFCMDTSITEDDSSQGGTTNEALLELAEMCSSELGHNKKGVLPKSKTVTTKPKCTALGFESKKLISPGKNSLLQEALKETACKVVPPGEVQVVQNNSTGGNVNVEKCKKFDFIQPAVVDSNHDRKPQEEESAIVTCGKMVVNHIIDKLFSSDLAQNSQGDLTKVKEKYKMREKTGRQIVQFSDMKPPLIRTNDLWCKKGKEGGNNSSKRDTVSEEKEASTLSFASSPVTGIKDEVMDLSVCKKQKEPTVEKLKELAHFKVEDKRKEDHVADRSKVKDGSEKKIEEIKHDTSIEKTPKKRPQSPEPREVDNTNEEGDDYLPVRKSRRRNRGQRYQELINEGIIQPSKERLAAMLSKHIHSEESEEEDFQSIDAHILPETAIRRIRKRTASESDKVKLTTGEDGKRYKTGDFDLEAHIAILPACSLESVGRKRGFSKTRHASDGQQCSPRRREDTSPTSPRSSDDSYQSGMEIKPDLIFEKSFSLPPHVKLKAEEIPNKPLVGSQKRKARKHSITHLHQLPPGAAASSSSLPTPLDIISSQESIKEEISSALTSERNPSENGNKHLTSTGQEHCRETDCIRQGANRKIDKDEGSDLRAGNSTEVKFSEELKVENMEDNSGNIEDVFNHTEREEHSVNGIVSIGHPYKSTCPGLKMCVKKNERKVAYKKDEQDQACQETTLFSNAKRIFNPAILSDVSSKEGGDLQLGSSLESNNTNCVVKDITKDVSYFVQDHCIQNNGIKVSSGINKDDTEKRLFDAGGEISISFENTPKNTDSSPNLGLLNLSLKIHTTQAVIESGLREVNMSKQIRSGETTEFEHPVHCKALGKCKLDTADRDMQKIHKACSDSENHLGSAVTTETVSANHQCIFLPPSNTNTSRDCKTNSLEEKRKDHYGSGKEEKRKHELYSNLHGLASIGSRLFGDSNLDENYKAGLEMVDPENGNSDLVIYETEVDNSTTNKCCDIDDAVHQVDKSPEQDRDNCITGKGDESTIGNKLTAIKKSPHAIAVAWT